MNKLVTITKRSFTSVMVLLLVGNAAPSFVFADNEPVAPTATSTAAPAADTTGPKKPTGPDANTYHYNETTGKWENDFYTWDPVTKTTSPKSAQTYSYNPVTGKWDTKDYKYNPSTGTYVPNVVSTDKPPQGAITVGDPAAQNANSQAPQSNLNTSSDNTGTFNGFYNATISNNTNSSAITGNALVNGNTAAGNATSGNAQVTSNNINLLQSASSLSNPNVLNFVSNVYGNVQGDLMIDPSQIAGQQAINTDQQVNNKLTINNVANGTINNNINLNAQSGNAGVTGNTSGGDATTGTANAVANVVNMINAATNANKSFIGTVNVYGNLDGDILLPPDMLNSLLASNAPSSTLDMSKVENSSLLANFTNNETINNNLTTTAATGNANVANNTSAGNATTGNANTNVTVLNLTGNDVVAKDALLVFVNVLGKWVGVIMNAPNSTSAALAGGVTSQKTQVSNSAVINDVNNATINNNINVNSKSGDATVSDNTLAGNALTGNATSSVNLANIINSHLDLSDWFGVLFINVFGTWNGSFGVNTEAGNKPVLGGMGGGAAATAASTDNVKVFKFVPTGTASYKVAPATYADVNPAAEQKQPSAVFAASTNTPSGPVSPSAVPKHSLAWMRVVAPLLACVALLGVEQFMTSIKRRKLAVSTATPTIASPAK